MKATTRATSAAVAAKRSGRADSRVQHVAQRTNASARYASLRGVSKPGQRKSRAESDHMRSIGTRATLTFLRHAARSARGAFRPKIAAWLVRHATDPRMAWLLPEELTLARQGFVGPVARGRLRRAAPLARVRIAIRRGAKRRSRARQPAYRQRTHRRGSRRPAARRTQSDSGGSDDGSPGPGAVDGAPTGHRSAERKQ